MKFEDLVDNAILLVKANIVDNMHYAKQMSPAQFCRNFCTVRIDIGRGVGKTNYIVYNATSDDLILVHNYTIADYLTRRHPHLKFDNARDIDESKYKIVKQKFRYVFIDEPELCFRNNREKEDLLYYALADENHFPIFILLGK